VTSTYPPSPSDAVITPAPTAAEVLNRDEQEYIETIPCPPPDQES